MSEWSTVAPVRAAIVEMRPYDALILWGAYEAIETNASRYVVTAWLRARVAEVHGIERPAPWIAAAVEVARQQAGDTRRYLWGRLREAGFTVSACGHAACDSYMDDGVLVCGACEDAEMIAAGEVWP